MSYADGTRVPAERSKAELDRLLIRHGATQRLVGADDERGVTFVLFRLSERQVRIDVPLPTRDETRLRRKPPRQTWDEQVGAERWRVFVLLVKAKLEAIELGLSTVEREFLADVFLPNGRRVHEEIASGIARSYLSGEMPPLLGMGAPVSVWEGG